MRVSRIRTEYSDSLGTDQKKLRIWTLFTVFFLEKTVISKFFIHYERFRLDTFGETTF